MLKLAIARSNFALVLLVSLRAAGGTCFDLGSARAIGPRDSVEESVGAGDFNRDGMLDIIFVRPTWPGTVQLLLNQGDGRFQIGAQYTVGDGAHQVSVADVNGDGKLDVVVACAMSDNLSVLMAKGDGTFNPAINYSLGTNLFGGVPPAAQNVLVADLNGDGRLDLVTPNANWGTVSVLLARTNGGFSSGVQYRVEGHPPAAVAAGDFNGDGISDLIVAHAGSPSDNYFAVPGHLSLLIGNGNGTFRPFVGIEVASPPEGGLVAGDFNADGRVDIAVVLGKTISIMLGKGNGTFQNGSNYVTGAHPICLIASDVNGDGITDLVTANEGSQTLSIFLGIGDGTFRPEMSQTAGGAARSVVAGDFTGDGNIDFAVGYVSASSLPTINVSLIPSQCPPRAVNLSIARSTAGIRISWPGRVNGLALQRTTNILSSDWQAVGTGPVLTNGDWQSFLPSSLPASYFRLQKP